DSTHIPSSTLVMSNSIFANGKEGVHLVSLCSQCFGSENSARVLGNDIYGNASSGVLLEPSVFFNGCNVTFFTTVDGLIERNYIHGNLNGITCLAAVGNGSGANKVRQITATIQNNLLVNNSQNGILMTGNVQQDLSPNIVNNTMVGNGNAGISHVIRQVGFK